MTRFRKVASLDLDIKKPKMEIKKSTYQLNDHYDFVENLGIGTYSYVKLAVDKKSGKEVAIKVCRRETAREMLRQEYSILKSINHPSVIKVFELIENDARQESYMIMEYFAGQDISKKNREETGFVKEEIKCIIKSLVECISHLHSLGIGHRDIKPENILINRDNKVKLIDFNISKSTLSKGSNSDDSPYKFKSTFYTQISSPLYAAPELSGCCGYSESIDIWGVGITMFSMLVGASFSHSYDYTMDASEKIEYFQQTVNAQNYEDTEMASFLFSLLCENPEDRPSAAECLTNAWLA